MNAAIEIKKLNGDNLSEFKQLLKIFADVFETGSSETADEDSLKKLLANSAFIVMVAMTDNKIMGGLTAYVLPSYSGNYSEVYLYDIAIDKEQQRSGLGSMLIDFLKGYCNKQNIKTIFVEAHEQDSHAVNFYRRTKATAEKVIHFNYEL